MTGSGILPIGDLNSKNLCDPLPESQKMMATMLDEFPQRLLESPLRLCGLKGNVLFGEVESIPFYYEQAALVGGDVRRF